MGGAGAGPGIEGRRVKRRVSPALPPPAGAAPRSRAAPPHVRSALERGGRQPPSAARQEHFAQASREGAAILRAAWAKGE